MKPEYEGKVAMVDDPLAICLSVGPYRDHRRKPGHAAVARSRARQGHRLPDRGEDQAGAAHSSPAMATRPTPSPATKWSSPPSAGRPSLGRQGQGQDHHLFDPAGEVHGHVHGLPVHPQAIARIPIWSWHDQPHPVAGDRRRSSRPEQSAGITNLKAVPLAAGAKSDAPPITTATSTASCSSPARFRRRRPRYGPIRPPFRGLPRGV